jgi:hypothetical protein
MKRYGAQLGLAVLLLLMLSGCGKQTETDAAFAADAESAKAENMFTDRDLEVGYDENDAALITLNGDTAECSSDAVTIEDGVITIQDEGTYILSGTLDDGMIVVDAKDEKIQLVLDGVTIHHADCAAIYIKEADKVFMTTAPDTENYLSNGGTYTAVDDNNIDGVIFSKSDLTLNGTGSLELDAEAGHGIVSKDDLVITGGTYCIQAASHGLSGKDSVRIANGNFTITAGEDGIKAKNDDDSDLGFVYIENGTFDIEAEGCGIKASGYLQLYDGDYEIASTDDAVHSNADVTIQGGTYQIETEDDGMHADAALTITDGSILISKSYEGLEGMTVDISGGEIQLTASDDGINAAGGNDQSGFGGGRGDQFAAQDGVYIQISGGEIYVNADGDGIDSNGDLTVSGGELYISGPTNGGNGALDYNGEGIITGGICIAAGASGMEQNFGTGSTQGTIMVNIGSQEAETKIELTDADGASILSWQPEKPYQSVIISCPEIVQGADYTITAGTDSTTVTMEDLVYGTGNEMGGPGRGMQNQNGKMERPDGEMELPDGEMQQPGEGMERPDEEMQQPGEGMEPPDGEMQQSDKNMKKELQQQPPQSNQTEDGGQD